MLPATTNKTIRFPDNIVEEVERALVRQQCSFSRFVVEAVRMALLDLLEQENNA
nr:YlcI/YnfO family protein [Maliibacterium massiliense]